MSTSTKPNQFTTIIDLVEQTSDRYASDVVLKEKVGDVWTETTYTANREIVHRAAAGLMSLGIEKGDKVALLSEGRNRWVQAELALNYAGGVSVPLSIKLVESSDLSFRIVHSEAKFIIVSGMQLPKIREIVAECPAVSKVIILDSVDDIRENEITFDDVLSLGEIFLSEHPNDLKARYESIVPEDLASITYTSGTTANPKGVMLTHGNFAANVKQALTRIWIDEGDVMLIILPLDHCFAHVAGFYIVMCCGGVMATVPSGKRPSDALRNIPTAIKEVRPHVMLSVPALAKNFKKNIENQVKAKGPVVIKLYNHALSLATSYNKEMYNKGGWKQWWKKPLIALYDRLIFKTVRQGFGGRMKFFVGGGAYLDIDLQRFFCAVGMPMYQGYGLSEATPIISVNPPADPHLGSSGLPLIPIEVKIMDDAGNELPVGSRGEIVIKGENVMAGYFKNPTATAETITDGCWLHTGDMGYVDSYGYLFVEGRFKSLLIGADGEKYSPEGIEESMAETSKFIEQIILHNSQDPFTTALIVPNIAALKTWAASEKLEWGSDAARRACLQRIHADVSQYRKGGKYEELFPDRWLPNVIIVLPEPFTEANGLVNSTMKIVRGKVEERYKDRIAYAYTLEGKPVDNPLNMEAIQ